MRYVVEQNNEHYVLENLLEEGIKDLQSWRFSPASGKKIRDAKKFKSFRITHICHMTSEIILREVEHLILATEEGIEILHPHQLLLNNLKFCPICGERLVLWDCSSAGSPYAFRICPNKSCKYDHHKDCPHGHIRPSFFEIEEYETIDY